MGNIIRSDFYRIKKGASLKGLVIAAIAIVLFIFIMSYSLTALTNTIPTTNMTETEIIEMQQESATIQESTLGSADLFVREMNGQSSVIFLFLGFIIAVFSTDFDFQTYKNTFSYESSRKKVYTGKFILTLALCLGIKLVTLISSVILSGIVIGFGGLNFPFLLNTIFTFILQIPIYASIIGVSFYIVVIFKKTSILNIFYLGGLVGISLFLQIVASLKDSLNWLILFDPLQSATMIAQSSLNSTATIVCVGIYVLITIITFLLGSNHLQKADLN